MKNLLSHGKMSPVWTVDGEVFGEPILFERDPSDGTITAQLAFKPEQIVSLYRTSGEAVSLKGCELDGNRILFRGRDDLSSLTRDELFPKTASDRTVEWYRDQTRYIHFSEGSYYHKLQFYLDYVTQETWTGPIPASHSEYLARTYARLQETTPFNIALVGDSISAGANASARTNAEPFQPPYGELFVDALQKSVCAPLHLSNFSKGCMRSDWAIEQVPNIIESQADLVVIAFGMNDASDGYPADQLLRNIQEAIWLIQQSLAECDIILLAGMTPNPDWHNAYPEVRETIRAGLIAMQRPGVAFCDVQSVWNELVNRKGFFSMTGNGINHPNDYGHRLYADCLYSLFGGK